MMTRFRILALDGGGIKGTFSAAVLAALEDATKLRCVDHFDLITGTFNRWHHSALVWGSG